jgi:hypothetical protein
MDLYHPRPLRFMMERMEELGGALMLAGETPNVAQNRAEATLAARIDIVRPSIEGSERSQKMQNMA